MTVGMFLAALAFVATALVQMQIDKTLPDFPSSREGQAKFISMVNRSLQVEAGEYNFRLDNSTEYMTFEKPFDLNVESGTPDHVSLPDGIRSTIVIVQDGPQLRNLKFRDITTKPEKGLNAIRFFNGFGSDLNVSIGGKDNWEADINDMSSYINVTHGTAKFFINDSVGNQCIFNKQLGFGSSYTIIIPQTFTFGQNCMSEIWEVEDIKPNSFHLAWQIPQYFLMTSGEVVFSVTGLEFSYSQAPSNMKSVLQAGWLLTVAIGNIVMIIVAESAALADKWAEYILFASLLVLVCIIFSIMAMFYTYTDPAKIEAQFAILEPEDKEKKNFSALEMAKKAEKNLYEDSKNSDFSLDEEGKNTKL